MTYEIGRCVSGYLVTARHPGSLNNADPRRWAFSTFKEAAEFLNEELDHGAEAVRNRPLSSMMTGGLAHG